MDGKRRTLLSTVPLVSFDGKSTNSSQQLYQRKIGCLLYAAVTTRVDVAHCAGKLAQYNKNPSPEHHIAADNALLYLYNSQYMAPKYGNDDDVDIRSFVCSSDAAFADDAVDRKSTQGFVLKLFGDPVAWRSSKQDTVTTSSTEAELLALSQMAKEAIAVEHLFQALNLQLDEKLTIEVDNRQTMRLIIEESVRLQTKLKHVDVHNHWLQQAFAQNQIQLE